MKTTFDCARIERTTFVVRMGSVHLQLQVLTRGLDISGMHVGGMTQAAAAERARRGPVGLSMHTNNVYVAPT